MTKPQVFKQPSYKEIILSFNQLTAAESKTRKNEDLFMFIDPVPIGGIFIDSQGITYQIKSLRKKHTGASIYLCEVLKQ